MPTTFIESQAHRADRAPASVAREFRELIAAGARLRPVGTAKDDPDILLTGRYVPKFRVDLFGTRFYVAAPSFDDHLGFCVAYVIAPPDPARRAPRPTIHPRLFYKDLSLVWRVATHLIDTDDDYWIGKGAVRVERDGDHEIAASAEETTNLPLELQGTLDDIRGLRHPRRDDEAAHLVLRRAPAGRIAPYADFTTPRERASPVNRGRPVAWFTRRNDPTSLRFERGYEPDFARGVVELTRSKSNLYGGVVRKYRIVSRNRIVQWSFMAARRHVWVIPPQSLTTDLTTYGVRATDVLVDDDLCVPGYEYHYWDDHIDPPELHTQIPPGYAGRPSPIDASRADASKWIESLPVVKRFRRVVLGS